MMTDIVNQFKRIEVKMPFTNSWKRCLKRLNTAKLSLRNSSLVMTKDDEQCFITMDGCHICGEKYDEKDAHVRDHCHITGKFKGSAHQECNLKLRIKPEDIKIPVIFHNLRGYDSHFIMQQIREIAKEHANMQKRGKARPQYQCHP